MDCAVAFQSAGLSRPQSTGVHSKRLLGAWLQHGSSRNSLLGLEAICGIRIQTLGLSRLVPNACDRMLQVARLAVVDI